MLDARFVFAAFVRRRAGVRRCRRSEVDAAAKRFMRGKAWKRRRGLTNNHKMEVLTNDKKLLTMTAAMLCLVVTPAEAACEQADLAGQWAMFMYGDNFETAALPFILAAPPS
jgi:hypothetical protein